MNFESGVLPRGREHRPSHGGDSIVLFGLVFKILGQQECPDYLSDDKGDFQGRPHDG